MTEIIKEINEVNDGFKIVTDAQEIHLGIDQSSRCCEEFGYFMSEDDLSQFIGAELRSVTVVDEALKTYDVVEEMYEGSTMFVNLGTSAGLLQFVAYNEHNGFYSHEAWVRSTHLNHEEWL